MATKQNDAVSIVDNSDEDVFEDVFASPELLLEATKFDDANVSHDVELKINPKVWKKPLKTYSCSSCESGVSCTGSPNQAKTILKSKRPKGKQFAVPRSNVSLFQSEKQKMVRYFILKLFFKNIL